MHYETTNVVGFFTELTARAGVALATLLAQAVSTVLVTRALMHSTDIYQLKLRNIRFHGRVLKSQLYVRLPGGFQTTMYSLSNLIIQAAINVYGTDTTAAWAAYGKLDAIFWMSIGADMLNQITPCYVIFIFIEVLSGALRGISDVVIPMLMLMILFGVCLLRIAWIFFIVPMNLSIHMVIINYPVTWITTFILFILYYLYKKSHHTASPAA